jgi:hypothetical protein
MSTSAVVPLVFWGSTPPKHVVTCILVTYDQKTVITGSKSGQLGVWDIRHLYGGKVEVKKLLTNQLINYEIICWYSPVAIHRTLNNKMQYSLSIIPSQRDMVYICETIHINFTLLN